jgi:hypothetical protein
VHPAPGPVLDDAHKLGERVPVEPLGIVEQQDVASGLGDAAGLGVEGPYVLELGLRRSAVPDQTLPPMRFASKSAS